MIFCNHSWRKSTNYADIWYDVCKKCGKKRRTNEENIQYSTFKLSTNKKELK